MLMYTILTNHSIVEINQPLHESMYFIDTLNNASMEILRNLVKTLKSQKYSGKLLYGLLL